MKISTPPVIPAVRGMIANPVTAGLLLSSAILFAFSGVFSLLSLAFA